MRFLRALAVVVFMAAILTGCGSSQQRHESAQGGDVSTGPGSVMTDRGRPSFDQRRGRPRPGPVGAIASGKGELLARVKRAYDRVPGVELGARARSDSAGAQRRRFLLALQDGSVSAEEFIDPGRHGFQLVARTSGPTFMRTAGTGCWRPLHHSTKRWILKLLDTSAGSLGRLQQSDPRTLLNVGYWFPDEGKAFPLRTKTGAEALEIETHDAFWSLAGMAHPSYLAPKSFITIQPNPNSHRITSIEVRAPERTVRATLSVEPLPVRPTIPRPTPTC
jgi:hypothetical protein